MTRSRSARRAASAAPSPHVNDPLRDRIAALAPRLSSATVARLTLMAASMRDAAAAFESCEVSHLVEDGFSVAEIEMGRHIARAAVEAVDADGRPDDAVAPFSTVDATALRRFNTGLGLAAVSR